MKQLLFYVLLLTSTATFAQPEKLEGFPEPYPTTPPTEAPKQEGVLTAVDEQAEFPGGIPALKKYLTDNMVYPPRALELGLQGKCYLKFVVSSEGNISNVTVMRGVSECPECDKEAIRVVRMMPNWIPAKLNGKAVNSYFNLPVTFKIATQHEPTPVPPPAPEPRMESPTVVVDEPAEYPGGISALKKFLADNIVYPQTARDNGIEGRCYLKFVVTKDGDITNVTIARGLANCPECDQEAIRVVKLMPKWQPGKNKGKPVDSYFNLPVAFKLSEPEKKEK